MRYLGIDYGEKRIGVAMSDADGNMAFPYSVIENSSKNTEKVNEICKKEKIDSIVIGESLDYKGVPNLIMKEVNKFKKELEEETGIEIVFHPEILTTQEARRYSNERHVDSSAAAIILQSYLDKVKHQ